MPKSFPGLPTILLIIIITLNFFSYSVNATCSTNCLSCGNQNNCTLCDSGYELRIYSKTNIGYYLGCYSCEATFFFDSVDSACKSCSPGCDFCSTSTNCTVCQPNYKTLVDDINSLTPKYSCEACAIGTYLSPDNTCLDCPEECKDCLGTDCLECKNKYGNNFICLSWVSSTIDKATSELISYSKLFATLATIINLIFIVSASFAKKGGSFYIQFFVFESFLFSLRFVGINHPKNMLEYFNKIDAKSGLKIGFRTLSSQFITEEFEIPSNFKHWVMSSRFVINYWDTFLTLIICFAVGHIIREIIHQFKLDKESQIGGILNKFQLCFRWTLFIAIICTNLDEVVIYGFLEFQSFSAGNSLSGFSKALAFIIILLSIAVVIASLRIVIKIRKESNRVSPKDASLKIFLESYESLAIIFKSLQLYSFPAEIYFFIFMFRFALWNIIIIAFQSLPNIQLILLLVLTILFTVYLLIYKPPKSKFALGVSLITEALLIAILSFMIMISKDSKSKNMDLGKILIYLNLAYPIGAFLIISFKAVRDVMNYYIKFKKVGKKRFTMREAFKEVIESERRLQESVPTSPTKLMIEPQSKSSLSHLDENSSRLPSKDLATPSTAQYLNMIFNKNAKKRSSVMFSSDNIPVPEVQEPEAEKQDSQRNIDVLIKNHQKRNSIMFPPTQSAVLENPDNKIAMMALEQYHKRKSVILPLAPEQLEGVTSEQRIAALARYSHMKRNSLRVPIPQNMSNSSMNQSGTNPYNTNGLNTNVLNTNQNSYVEDKDEMKIENFEEQEAPATVEKKKIRVKNLTDEIDTPLFK